MRHSHRLSSLHDSTMRLPGLLSLLAVAVLPFASAQSTNSSGSSSSASNAAQITVITSLSTSVGLISRTPTTSVATILITSTILPTQAPVSDTNSQSSSASSSTTTANLPTGTVAVVTDQAPSPGATGGAYGPPDNYINAARSLQGNAMLLVGVGAVVGFLAV
ncbi:hypothetical protein B0H19DRAFT_1127386 [Mycena capillaripes]|nr:hypothetical protein B0H19DRAFT_1127386 [Mycena capillaripes]